MLLKMVEEEQMTILNATDKCKGLWTREQGSTKSILDYLLTKEEDKVYAREIMIDEEKVITPFRIVKKKGSIKTIYTDHNAIVCRLSGMDGRKLREPREKNKIMTERSYKQFKRRLEENKVSEIWKKSGNVQQLYDYYYYYFIIYIIYTRGIPSAKTLKYISIKNKYIKIQWMGMGLIFQGVMFEFNSAPQMYLEVFFELL